MGNVTQFPKATRGAKPPLAIEIALDAIDTETVPGFRTDDALDSLTESIKNHGLLQPINVRPTDGKGHYEIIAGRRRYKAVKALGLATIPAMIGMPTDDEAAVQSLVENLERRALSPLEEAAAFQTLIAGEHMLQKDLGARIGRSQSYISNSMGLLDSPDTVKDALASGKITVSHAKAMATLPAEKQVALVDRIIEQKIPSRVVEQSISEEKERNKREVQIAATRVAEAQGCVAAIKGAGDRIRKETRIFAQHESAAEALVEAGWPNAVSIQTSKSALNKMAESVGCDCDAVEVSAWNGNLRVEKVCCLPAHHDAWRSKRDAERREKASVYTKKVEAARKRVTNALQIGGAAISPAGTRVMLYCLLRADSQKAMAFTKRLSPDATLQYHDYGPLWGVIEALPIGQVIAEVVHLMVLETVPNVFSEQNRWALGRDSALRQWFVETMGIDPEMVRGLEPEA